MLKPKEDRSSGGQRACPQVPRARALSPAMLAATPADFSDSVFDLKLAVECGMMIMLVRAVVVSADRLCRCCGLGVWVFYLHTPVGFTPFPVQGFTPLNSLTAECGGCCSSHRVQAQHCGLSL